jgi:diguanylate cyclase (GGDEF)-like protein
LVCRFGGEEFVVLLSHSVITNAEVVAERIREDIARLSLHSGGRIAAVTASIGIAEVLGVEGLDDAILRADQALYEAKASGRDRVVLAPPLTGTDNRI